MYTITENIYIGNSSDAKCISKDDIDVSLNVAFDLDILKTQKDDGIIRHKVGLIDGYGNTDFSIISAVLLLHSLCHAHSKILIHCHEGKSRSVMVTAMYMAISENIEFDFALEKVMLLRGINEYKLPIYNHFKSLYPKIKELWIQLS